MRDRQGVAVTAPGPESETPFHRLASAFSSRYPKAASRAPAHGAAALDEPQ